jgi:thymidylate kinase
MHNYGDQGSLIPDLTIIFDIPAEVAFEWAGKRKSEEECFEEIEFQKKLVENQNFIIEELRKRDKRKIIVINSNQPIEDVTKEMVVKIKKELS